MADVFLLIEEEADNYTVVLGAYSTRQRARDERKRIYAARDTERLITQQADYLRTLTPIEYRLRYGNVPIERAARYRYETILIESLTLNNPVKL